ncbi:nucleolar complex-associated protein 3 [Russula earlei]|uniref:Nucleolar complex-associated protein 3 n=1 Tax=Russula earlei TaxID=71964 RepID=A0ACC0U3A1_9AGAM|nr:nucleolar complex-associated protein 3 [Russula earlei]
MGTKAKRPTQAGQVISKRRKIAPSWGVSPIASKSVPAKGKQRAFQRTIIEVPRGNHDSEGSELGGEDLGVTEEFGAGASFLESLDEKGISRSKWEQERLRRLDRPVRKAPIDDDLPSVISHTDGEEVCSSDITEDLSEVDPGLSEGDISGEHDLLNSSRSRSRKKRAATGSDAEMSYETVSRRRRQPWPEGEVVIDGLPIKLRDGQIKRTGPKLVIQAQSEEKSDDSPSERRLEPEQTREDITTGARFRRLPIIDVISNPSRKLRIQIAKEQIASLCEDIVSDPENSLGLLRRLHTFSLPEVSSPAHPEPVRNDPYIRKLTTLSQLAVFKDIIPGYRIRELTDKEKAEKVSQMVSRTREWEQGLVSVYQNYLRCLDGELKAKSSLQNVALQCLCTLLVEVTHFNFRINIMSAIVARLSKKSWDETSNLCLDSLISVFRADETGVPSLEIVRLLNRMIKERQFNVHSNVLTCLLHLRLKTELGVRASEAKVEREEIKREKAIQGKKSKGQGAASTHLSKKARRTLKERKEIEKEMKDAEASVDKEERASNQTETLKLLFVLYFCILKNFAPTPLLPAALQGISKFSHLVSIDFFRDLMSVLKDLATRPPYPVDGGEYDGYDYVDRKVGANVFLRKKPHAFAARAEEENARHQLSCILTAYELLSGQGEALNVDLSDFTTQLYSLIQSLSLAPEIDASPVVTRERSAALTSPPPRGATAATVNTTSNHIADATATATATRTSAVGVSPTSDLLFRALQHVFSPRAAIPPWRAAAFTKRLLTAALHWPGAVALRALEFVAKLMARESRLEALLSTEDRTVDGVYRPDVEDPQLSNPFATSAYELHLLQTIHVDARVREAAAQLANYVRT